MPLIKRKPSRNYTDEYKIEAVKLSRKIGKLRAATELSIPVSTLDGWIRYGKYVETYQENQSLENTKLLVAENQKLKIENKALTKSNALLKKENEFLEEASSFFAASRQKLAREKE